MRPHRLAHALHDARHAAEHQRLHGAALLMRRTGVRACVRVSAGAAEHAGPRLRLELLAVLEQRRQALEEWREVRRKVGVHKVPVLHELPRRLHRRQRHARVRGGRGQRGDERGVDGGARGGRAARQPALDAQQAAPL